MRKLPFFVLIFIFSFGSMSFGQNEIVTEAPTVLYPASTGWVNDVEQLFSPEEEKELFHLLDHLEQTTSIEVVLVTLDSTYTSSADFYSYSIGLANHWGIGKKNKDNGVLITISRSLRTMRISTGLGMESILSDAEMKNIIDTFFIPPYREGNYFEGTRAGINELIHLILLKSEN